MITSGPSALSLRSVWRGQAGGAAPYDDLPPMEAYDEAAQEGTRRHTAGAKAAHGVECGPGNGASPAGVCDSEEWSEPGQIQAALHPVPPSIRTTLLPEALRAWVKDEADRMPCPPDFMAAAGWWSLARYRGAVRDQAQVAG